MTFASQPSACKYVLYIQSRPAGALACVPPRHIHPPSCTSSLVLTHSLSETTGTTCAPGATTQTQQSKLGGPSSHHRHRLLHCHSGSYPYTASSRRACWACWRKRHRCRRGGRPAAWARPRSGHAACSRTSHCETGESTGMLASWSLNPLRAWRCWVKGRRDEAETADMQTNK